MPDIIVTVVSGETVNLGLAVPGVQGPQGIQGPSGATGPTGLSGVTPTFVIGSVVTTTASGANVTMPVALRSSSLLDFLLIFLALWCVLAVVT